MLMPTTTHPLAPWTHLDARARVLADAPPRATWTDTGASLELTVQVVGLDPADIAVSAHGQHLTLTRVRDGARRTTEWVLASEWDPSQATARLSRGLLMLAVPRRPRAEPTPIPVEDVDLRPRSETAPEASPSAASLDAPIG